MRRRHRLTPPLLALAVSFVLAGWLAFGAVPAAAHCDGLDGPVVGAARKALADGDVNPVLAWVRADDEAGIRHAFDHARRVRKLGAEARDLADTYFFETLVRVHRAGEGVAFTGLKPAGRDLGPAIPAADRALESGQVDALMELLDGEMRQAVRERFAAARAAREHRNEGVAQGRDYVARYVEFIHAVEALHETATRPSGGHLPEEDTAPAHEPAPAHAH